MNIKKAARCLRLISEQLEPPAEPAAQAPEPEADPVEVTAAEQAARIAAGKEAHRRAKLAELPLGQLCSVPFWAEKEVCLVFLHGAVEALPVAVEERVVEREVDLWVWQRGQQKVEGTFELSIGSRGSGNGQFCYPTGVAVVGDRLFVADTHNHRIVVCGLDGTFERSFGSLGSGNGQFNGP